MLSTIKKLLLIFLFVPMLSSAQTTAGKVYTYDSVPGDPLKARIYTLTNGLKVYISVYKDEPRFQSMIGVKVGSKNDPADHTGLAHYLEHMLFKGTDKYGTNDYAKEAPLLDSISALYDLYGKTTDSLKRAKIYHKIDSVSGVASHFAIANEFDKMMAGLGVSGVNAFTSVEQTVYVNDVPSNQLETFLTIEAERFRNPVMRLFHTELEAVYEEKNRGLDNDGRKVNEAINAGLFQHHQYGTQTTIGTIEHLKNPSLREIHKFLETYYVPNNMVIALSGDIDPDQAIRLIDEKFGKMPKKEIPGFIPAQESFIKKPIVKDVYGPDAESVSIGFRFGGAASPDADVLTIVDYILSNGQAGLLDLNLNNSQKVLSSSSSTDIMKDYSTHVIMGKPREGQTLEEVRDLLLKQIMEIKLGNFPDWIIPAIVANMKVERAKSFESNSARTSAMLETEILGLSYQTKVNELDRLSKINKQQVIDFVRTWYGDNYVIVYKHTGEDKNIIKVVKPAITPIEPNRELQSDFVKGIFARNTPAIQPVFIDFSKSIKTGKLASGIPVYSVQNKENNLFELSYNLDMGTNHNQKLSLALQYLSYLGTDKFNSAQLKEEFYKIGCEYKAVTSEDQSSIQLSGSQENFVQALTLFESLLANPQPDSAALANLIDDVLKRRENTKLNKNSILSAMQSYLKFGKKSPTTNIISEEQLKTITPKELIVLIRNLTGYQHYVDYYGPADSTSIVSMLNKFHKVPKLIQAVPTPINFPELSTDTSKVFVVNYDMKQAEIIFLSKGARFDESLLPKVTLYNRYFGGSMASPVFQTMRESKALAYSVASRYSPPSIATRSFYNFAYIGTQVDKLPEAMAGMMDLLTEFPESEKGFQNAKDGAMQQIQTERITKSDILSLYHRNKKLGLNDDYRKLVYDQISTLTLKDIRNFQETYLKNKNFQYVVLGNQSKLKMDVLKKYGPVTELSLTDIFGY